MRNLEGIEVESYEVSFLLADEVKAGEFVEVLEAVYWFGEPGFEVLNSVYNTTTKSITVYLTSPKMNLVMMWMEDAADELGRNVWEVWDGIWQAVPTGEGVNSLALVAIAGDHGMERLTVRIS